MGGEGGDEPEIRLYRTVGHGKDVGLDFINFIESLPLFLQLGYNIVYITLLS